MESGMGKRPVRMVEGSEGDRKEDTRTGDGMKGEGLREAGDHTPIGGRAHDDGRASAHRSLGAFTREARGPTRMTGRVHPRSPRKPSPKNHAALRL